ncbi:MAG: serine--tRNA ligase [Planctomycetota bacterium]
MLDMRYVRENLQTVRDGTHRKGFEVDLDQLLKLDDRRRELQTELDELRRRQKQSGKQIARLQGPEKEQAVAEMSHLSERVKELQGTVKEVIRQRDDLLCRVPNPPDSEVPDGVDDSENVQISQWGEIPEFDFEPQDHVTIGLKLGILEFQRASKLAGPQTYITLREGALLELAVLRFALDHMLTKGFVPMIVPNLVKYETLYGTAYFPGGEEQAYLCDRDRLYLAGTSEVPVTSFHSGEMLSEDDLPLYYCGYSTCYRREAGAAGRDTRGLYRIHQFNKVEQVVLCKNDEQESKKQHQFILQNCEEILQALELPYRVVNVCTGELGMGQVQKFDVECWMPSRGWGETHSASRFHEYQARRLELRYRGKDEKVHFCHTLNNTAIATPRVLISILENNQLANGGVRIPPVLVPYIGGQEQIQPR